jgi:glycerophosphoryl diester phosphodiesterase
MIMLNTIPLEDDTQITAHRGASADAPENTMAAVIAAIDQGADWVEIDVQETADGRVVVFHDSDFKRVADKELKIWDATLDDLQDLDIGSWFAAEFRDERVPTLEQVLNTCQGKAGVNIELKFYGHDERLEERVIEIVERYNMESEVVVMSLKLESVQRMRKLRPSWQVGLLTAAAIGSLRRVDADFLAVSAGTATRDFIHATHRSGKKVHVWTINDPIAMSTMFGRAADNLITDKPAVARQVLEERAKLGLPERVLLGVAELFGVKPLFSQQ